MYAQQRPIIVVLIPAVTNGIEFPLKSSFPHHLMTHHLPTNDTYICHRNFCRVLILGINIYNSVIKDCCSWISIGTTTCNQMQWDIEYYTRPLVVTCIYMQYIVPPVIAPLATYSQHAVLTVISVAQYSI